MMKYTFSVIKLIKEEMIIKYMKQLNPLVGHFQSQKVLHKLFSFYKKI
jgi:hypothetical protein